MTESAVAVSRRRFYCAKCNTTTYPIDSVLGIAGKDHSPDYAKLIGHITALTRSHQAAKKVLAYTGKSVISVTKIRKIAHSLGKLLVDSEDTTLHSEVADKFFQTQEQKDKIISVSIDGGRCRLWQSESGQKLNNSQWKEAKLGCFAEYRLFRNETGEMENKLERKKYIGRVDETSTIFGERLYREALIRGFESAKHKVFLADGAKYNWDVQQTHFSSATAILDWYHATEHLAVVGREVFGEESDEGKKWLKHAEDVLFEGDFFYLDELLWECKQKVKRASSKKIIATEREYFFHNRHRIKYKIYRDMGLPISSCLVESGMKITVNDRIKGSEKHWHSQYANYILALKIAECNDGQQKVCQLLENAA